MAKDGWLICPNCGGKRIMPILPETTATHLLVHCKKCGADSVVNIAAGRSVELIEIIPRGMSLSLRA